MNEYHDFIDIEGASLTYSTKCGAAYPGNSTSFL